MGWIPWSPPLLVLSTWAIYLTTQSLNTLLCKMEIIICLSHRVVGGLNDIIHTKHLCSAWHLVSKVRDLPEFVSLWNDLTLAQKRAYSFELPQSSGSVDATLDRLWG